MSLPDRKKNISRKADYKVDKTKAHSQSYNEIEIHIFLNPTHMFMQCDKQHYNVHL